MEVAETRQGDRERDKGEGIGCESAYEYLHGVIISSPEESRISAGEFSTCYFAPRHSASLYKPLFFPLAPRRLNRVPRADPPWTGPRLSFRVGHFMLFECPFSFSLIRVRMIKGVNDINRLN